MRLWNRLTILGIGGAFVGIVSLCLGYYLLTNRHAHHTTHSHSHENAASGEIGAKNANSANSSVDNKAKYQSHNHSTTAHLKITKAWVRASLGTSKLNSAYMNITNSGTTPDRLIAVTSSGARNLEIHQTQFANGVARMRPLNDGLAIKPQSTLSLAPSGYHIMLEPMVKLSPGDRLNLTLEFERAGEITISAPVAISAGGNEEHSHDH